MSHSSALVPTPARSQPSSKSSTTSGYVFLDQLGPLWPRLCCRRSKPQSNILSPQVLIDGTSEKPEESVPRHAANLSYMSLTGIVIPKLPRGIGSGALRKKWIEHEVESQWNNSSFAKSRAKSIRRKELSDFERFKVMKLRKQARFEVRKTLAAAKASS